MEIINLIATILIGTLSSLVASLLYLFIFSRLRPKIEISSKIAKTINSDGKTVFKVKIINRGKRPIINIKAKLDMTNLNIVPKGVILTNEEIALKRNEIMGIPGFSKNDKEALYAYRFVTYEDIESHWTNDETAYIRFRIFASDSLSGLGKFYSQEFRIKRISIVSGDFEFGDSFEIV